MSKELKVGDLIAVNAEFGRAVQLHRVEKVTGTMYVTKGYRFRRDTLRIVGPGRFGPFNGRIPTADDVLKVRIQKASAALSKMVLDEQNIDAAEALIANATQQRNATGGEG